MKWIFKNFQFEFLLLYLPGLLSLILSHSFFKQANSYQSVSFLLYAFLAKEFIDSGHVYTTVWRTYFNKNERSRSPLYWQVPLLFFLLFFAWGFFELPYLGSFVVYATLFHNMRQFYGVSKWYQRLNSVYSQTSDLFFYLLCTVPIVGGHFRSDVSWNSYYSENDFFMYPQPYLLLLFKSLYVLTVLAWLFFEWRQLKAQKDYNRFLSVMYPAVLYGLSFWIGRTAVEIVFPLVVAHGIGYFAMMSVAMQKTQPRFKKIYFAVGAVLLTALLFGVIEAYVEDEILDLKDPKMALWVALYLTPLFCHYYFDGFLWKSKHHEAKAIYAG